MGIAEMVRAIREGRPQPMPPDFLMHLNELTLLIHRAGARGHHHETYDQLQAIEPPPMLSSSSRLSHQLSLTNLREVAARHGGEGAYALKRKLGPRERWIKRPRPMR